MNAPVKIQPRESALLMLDLVEVLEGMERSPDAILRTMEIEGAMVGVSGGARFVRYRGIVGTSTSTDRLLLNSWTRAARRKFKLGEYA
ncbi:hypothetical protein [Sphingomonas sp.]|uniref:hypothetical protein n=1 Tax=Sphingomonas sp. TaxID=28214 RepID=UPI00307FA456